MKNEQVREPRFFPSNFGRAGHRTEGIEKRGMFVLQSGPFWSNVHLQKAYIISSFPSFRFRRAIDLIYFLKNIYPWKILFKVKFRHFTLCCIFPLPLGIILGTHKVNVTPFCACTHSHTLSLSLTFNKIELWCVFFVSLGIKCYASFSL